MVKKLFVILVMIALTFALSWADVELDANADGDIDIGFMDEAELEGILDLQDLQGAVTDAQVPNDITITALVAIDTEAELKVLYNLEDADISTLATVVVTSMLGAAHDSAAELAVLLGGKVGTEGAETIAGVKTFASAPLFEVGFDVSPSVDPTMELKDSDAPGTDKESAKIVSNYIDGAVGAENHDLMFYVKQGGAYVLGLLLNESEDRWEFLKNTTFQAGDIQYEELAPSARGVETTGSFAAPITANPYSLTTALSYDAVLFYGAAGEVDLAAGVDGMSVVVYNAGADTVTIDPDGTEMVTRDGIVQPAGVSITLSSGAGNFVALVFDGTQWVTMGYKGTLAEGS